MLRASRSRRMGPRLRRGPKWLLRLGEVLRDEVPVDEVVEERLHEIGPAVLEVEIIGVLPHVAGHQRGLALAERVDRIRRPGDRELAAAGDEPGPAAAELADRGGLEIVLELGEAAEIAVDRLREVAARGAAAIGLHAVPEEGMVPHLRGVV